MSFDALKETVRSTLADLAYTRQKTVNLKDWPEVRLNPSLIVFVSILLFLLEVSERELNASVKIEQGKQLPNPTIKQIVDYHEDLIATVDGLVSLVQQSLDIPQEIAALVRDALRIFSVKGDFILLTWPELSTRTLGSLVPLDRLPERVREYLKNRTFAAIMVPSKVSNNPEYWPRIVHEVAHNVDSAVRLTDAVLSKHATTIARLSFKYELSLRSLCRERVADLLAVRAYGVSYARSSLMVFLRGEAKPLPTHPAGTKRLFAIAEELEAMGFKDYSVSLKERVNELQEKGFDQVLTQMDLTPPLEADVKSQARQFCSDRRIEMNSSMVSEVESTIKNHLLLDAGTGRFTKLTPCGCEVRLIFALFDSFARTNSGYDTRLLHGWIRDSVRLNPYEMSELPQGFYSHAQART